MVPRSCDKKCQIFFGASDKFFPVSLKTFIFAFSSHLLFLAWILSIFSLSLSSRSSLLGVQVNIDAFCFFLPVFTENLLLKKLKFVWQLIFYYITNWIRQQLKNVQLPHWRGQNQKYLSAIFFKLINDVSNDFNSVFLIFDSIWCKNNPSENILLTP